MVLTSRTLALTLSVIIGLAFFGGGRSEAYYRAAAAGCGPSGCAAAKAGCGPRGCAAVGVQGGYSGGRRAFGAMRYR
jgi:hypothetical protein